MQDFFPPGAAIPDRWQTVHPIRERLRADGHLPEGDLPSEIDASWRHDDGPRAEIPGMPDEFDTPVAFIDAERRPLAFAS